jgi:hypothetical protein
LNIQIAFFKNNINYDKSYRKFNESAYEITHTIIRKEAKDHLAYLLDDKDWQVLVTNSTKDGKNNIRVNINYEATDSDDFLYLYFLVRC